MNSESLDNWISSSQWTRWALNRSDYRHLIYTYTICTVDIRKSSPIFYSDGGKSASLRKQQQHIYNNQHQV